VASEAIRVELVIFSMMMGIEWVLRDEMKGVTVFLTAQSQCEH
jgi:hypothetical protein